jgi:hypothetical protein
MLVIEWPPGAPRIKDVSMSLFVVPPYVNNRSFVPLVIVDPARLLADRLSLTGALRFDGEIQQRRGQVSDFASALPELAAIATRDVAARFRPGQALAVQQEWEGDNRLPGAITEDLDRELPPQTLIDAIEDLVASTRYVGYAKLFKTISLSANQSMLDRWIRQGLRGSNSSDADWAQQGTLSFWLTRFRVLLSELGSQLAEIAAPSGFQYSPTDKLDRLLWLGHWGAQYWLSEGWMTITDFRTMQPSEVADSRGLLDGLPMTGRAAVYARRRARVVAPRSRLDPGGEPAYPFDRLQQPADRQQVREILLEAAAVTARADPR